MVDWLLSSWITRAWLLQWLSGHVAVVTTIRIHKWLTCNIGEETQ